MFLSAIKNIVQAYNQREDIEVKEQNQYVTRLVD